MIRLVAFFFFSFSAFHTFSQLTPTVTPVVDQFGTVKTTNKDPQADGSKSVYLVDEWVNSNIYLRQAAGSNMIENIPIKVDLLTNSIELQSPTGVKVLSLSKVDKFEWVNPANGKHEAYTNCGKVEGGKLSGFCVVSGDEVKLIRHHHVQVIKPDYNVALDVGSKEERTIKKTTLYLVKNQRFVEYSKRSVYALMEDKQRQVKDFVKKNKLNLNEEADLNTLVDYYNSI